MGLKTTRPNGQRYHTRNIAVRQIPDSQDFLVLGSLDEDVITKKIEALGIDISDVKVDIDWWHLDNGIPREWVRDEDRGEPGAYVSV